MIGTCAKSEVSTGGHYAHPVYTAAPGVCLNAELVERLHVLALETADMIGSEQGLFYTIGGSLYDPPEPNDQAEIGSMSILWGYETDGLPIEIVTVTENRGEPLATFVYSIDLEGDICELERTVDCPDYNPPEG